jgi:hypothetical protein
LETVGLRVPALYMRGLALLGVNSSNKNCPSARFAQLLTVFNRVF